MLLILKTCCSSDDGCCCCYHCRHHDWLITHATQDIAIRFGMILFIFGNMSGWCIGVSLYCFDMRAVIWTTRCFYVFMYRSLSLVFSDMLGAHIICMRKYACMNQTKTELNRTVPILEMKIYTTLCNEWMNFTLRRFDTIYNILRIKNWCMNGIFLDESVWFLAKKKQRFLNLGVFTRIEKTKRHIQIRCCCCWSSVEMWSFEAAKEEHVSVHINWFLTRFGGCTFRKCLCGKRLPMCDWVIRP